MAPTGSFHRDRGGGGFGKAVVAGPFEFQRAAFGGHCEESDERISGDSGREVGAEDLLAIVAAREKRHDVAPDARADGRIAVAGFHDVSYQCLDLEYLAALDLGRHIDQ